jgi:hypothetical protein
MQYIEPEITNVLKADSAIQGMDKGDNSFDMEPQPTGNAGYRSDE